MTGERGKGHAAFDLFTVTVGDRKHGSLETERARDPSIQFPAKFTATHKSNNAFPISQGMQHLLTLLPILLSDVIASNQEKIQNQSRSQEQEI